MNTLTSRLQRMKTCEYWTIAYRKRNVQQLLPFQERAEGFVPIPRKKYITQADPFLYRHKGQNYLFYEQQDLTDMQGTLWCRNLDDSGEKPQLVLQEDFHLSYPQIFRYGKYTYLVPESRQADGVRLYKCRRFPGEWELVGTLFEMPAVDTTFLLPLPSEGEEKRAETEEVYGFTYVQGHLKIYRCRSAQATFGWQRAEEIYDSGENQTVRPGGQFIREEGRLLRPAQDCREYYGKELIFYEVTELSEKGMKEREYSRISPEKVLIPGLNPTGIHTYNYNGDYEVIDVLHRQVSWDVVWRKLRWKWKNFWKRH